jgi:predicted Ser/Thr protein kinase
VAIGLVGATIAGYRIEDVAGRGGMGVVYRARDAALERAVALKVIAPEFAREPKFRKRFVREALATAGIDHPNVIPVYDAGEDDDGQLYIAMRFVDGDDLGTLLHVYGALDPALAAEIVAQAASALDAAHVRGLIHRDVKPANVLVARGERPHVYLTDFGLAKWEDTSSGLTTTGGWLGTPDYLAPEQVDGGKPDARTDVYALGCVLYAALTGRPPFADVPRLRKATAHMQELPPPLRDVAPAVPKAFDPVVRRALAKDPAKRYASAGELGAAALQAASERTGRTRRLAPGSRGSATAHTRRIEPTRAAPTAKIVEPRGRQRRSGRAIAIALAAAGVAAAAALVLGLGLIGGGGSNPRRAARHHPAAPKPPAAPTAAAGTVRCSASACAQAGQRVQAPIEDGTCAGGTGSWTRIDASGNPLIVCMADSNPPDGSAPQLSTVPDVIHGELDLVHDYLDGLAISHDTSGGGLFGIIDNSAWEVCATSPPVGSALPPDGKVQLYAQHSC